tara:strand:+ start:154 stop:663 length:510 start_codon:yes stop_codon:yes gene_type:complete
MATFKFSREELRGAEEEEPLKKIEGGAFDYVPQFQLKPEDRFTSMGGCPVALRASIVRLAFFKLLGTGVLCAIVAGSFDSSAAYSCGLCAAVNFIACVHYAIIIGWRSHVLPKSFEAFVSKVGLADRDDGNDGRRLLVGENAVGTSIVPCSLPHAAFCVVCLIRFLLCF